MRKKTALFRMLMMVASVIVVMTAMISIAISQAPTPESFQRTYDGAKATPISLMPESFNRSNSVEEEPETAEAPNPSRFYDERPPIPGFLAPVQIAIMAFAFGLMNRNPRKR